MTNKVIIFGAGEIADIAYFYLSRDSEFEVVAFTMDKEYINKEKFHGLPIVDFETIHETYPAYDYRMFIPISYKNVNRIRTQKYIEAKQKGYSFISYISSKAVYYDTPVGENCMILENSVIQPYSKIGNNVIMWGGSHLCHHSVIKDNCFIASNVAISGACEIGENTFIGANATIRDSIKVSRNNVIGAGTVILKDTQENAVYINNTTIKCKHTSDELRRI